MRNKGFILVELLVTISIIGLLIAAAAFSLGNSRSNARDAARFSDGITISKALDGYAAANRGSYPMTATATCTDDYQAALGAYLPNAKAIPKDPRPLQPGNSTVNYLKCYTVYRNAIGAGAGYAETKKFSYLIEVGIEKQAPADLSSYQTASELGVAEGLNTERTPFYFPGVYCDATCP
jgi:prepilin-type N-terminal cleavage/methylation domain-containing protein